jgi:hypothetical protein
MKLSHVVSAALVVSFTFFGVRRAAAEEAQEATQAGEIVRSSGAHTCIVAERGALEDIDARTAADIVCAELAKQGAAGGRYTLRFGKLGTRTRFVLANEQQEEREAWISSIDELPVASTRTVEALRTHKSVDETSKVDTALSSEGTLSRTKVGKQSGTLSIIGATSAGVESDVSAGVGLGIHHRTSRYALFGEGRLVGIGSSKSTLSEASVGFGTSIFFSDADVSPFAGGGLQLAYYRLSQESSGASGLAPFVEAGVAAARSSRVGFSASLRAAVPLFEIGRKDGYALPLSLSLGLTFL